MLGMLADDYSGPSVWPRAKIDPKEAWAIAAIAASLVVPGKDDELAINHAIRLVEHAAFLLGKKAEQANKLRAESRPPLTLDGMMAEFGLKKKSTIRDYLFESIDKDRAIRIWKDAMAGEAVFVWWVTKALREHRQKIHTDRSRKAALGRKKAVSGDSENVVK